MLLLQSGMCYKAKICNILFPLRCAIAWYYFLPKSKFSDSSQKPWSIIRRFGRNSADSLWSFNSNLEGATKLIFASFVQRGHCCQWRTGENWSSDVERERTGIQILDGSRLMFRGRLSRDLRSYCMAQEIQPPLPALTCKQPHCYLHRVLSCYY